MDRNVVQLAKQLLESGFTDFSDREKRVITQIASRLHVARDLNRTLEEQQTFADGLQIASLDLVVRGHLSSFLSLL